MALFLLSSPISTGNQPSQDAMKTCASGDKIKYQNGFGAWVFHIYKCDLDASGNVLAVSHTTRGRLPE
jgi:hypothetical protein